MENSTLSHSEIGRRITLSEGVAIPEVQVAVEFVPDIGVKGIRVGDAGVEQGEVDHLDRRHQPREDRVADEG